MARPAALARQVTPSTSGGLASTLTPTPTIIRRRSPLKKDSARIPATFAPSITRSLGHLMRGAADGATCSIASARASETTLV
jgi:hypothetical protein